LKEQPGQGAPHLALEIQPQPDDLTCGATCLHAVYRYYGDPIPLAQVVGEVVALETGGTLEVLLACHALRRGYRATIYTYNLQLFDPTWFAEPGVDLAAKLAEQARIKSDPKLRFATEAYLEFLSLGGRVKYEELSARVLGRHLRRGHPLLAGLSSTYLYGSAREDADREFALDDVRGTPGGHFVVLHGYEPEERIVQVADPYEGNPLTEGLYYAVGMDRLVGAILLGVITWDANLTIVEPGPDGAKA
jgi:peptidase C39-like protein